MSILIREDKGNSILIQAGNGVPTHLSTIGSLFVDKNTAIPYINKNGLSNWSQIFDNTSVVNDLPSTGVITFGGIQKTSNTTFSVSAATGWIIDNITNPFQPTQTRVTFSGATNLDSPYRTTGTITYILLNIDGTLSYQPYPPTPQQRRQSIYLGKIGHPDKANFSIAFQVTDHVQSPVSQLRDMFTPIPLINAGISVYANTGLTISNTAGTLYGLGISFPSSPLSPNTVSVSAQTPVTFQYRTQTGGTLGNTTLVDPLYYDNAGVRTAIGSPAKQATNQRVFVLQDGSFRLQYGQTIYTDLATALAAIPTEPYVTFSNWRDNGILIGILSMESDVAALTDTTKARFTSVSKFGEIAGTAGGGGGSGTATLQSAYNNSTTPEIITNSALDGFTIRRGSASDSDNLIELQNGAGSTVSSINALGNAIFNNVSATTISATTYLNLPRSATTFVTAFTYTANTLTISDSSGTTFNTVINVMTGLTINGKLGLNTSSPDTSSLVDLVSTTTGILIPRMTTTQINAISSPAQGLLAYSTDENVLMYYDTEWGWWSDNMDWLRNNGFDRYEDFIHSGSRSILGYPYGGFTSVIANSGTLTGATVTSNRPGIVSLNTLTATNSRSSLWTDDISSASGLIIGGGKILFEADVRIPTLADGTDTFRFFMGFSNNPQGIAGVGISSISIFYDTTAAYGASSATTWQVGCVNNNSRSFTTITGVTVTAGQWYRLKIVINSLATQVDFYIDNTLVKSETVNIPSTSTSLPFGFVHQRSAGTAPRSVHIDWYRIRQKFTTQR